MIGQQLSQYTIESELGRGGMGIVYRAQDTKLNRTVAIKVLPAKRLEGGDDRVRFLREARAAAQLNHPNIATIYEIDDESETPFIAMELVEGEAFRSFVLTFLEHAEILEPQHLRDDMVAWLRELAGEPS